MSACILAQKDLDILVACVRISFMQKTLVSLLLVLDFVFAIGAVAEPSRKNNHPSSLGVEQFYNQNAYLLGLPVAGQVLGDGAATSIRFLPYNTPLLYDESVLFCGDTRDAFKGKRGVIAITYDRVAHRAYQGVACHDLVSVFEISVPKGGAQ